MPIMQIQKLNVTLHVVLQNNIYTKSATLRSGFLCTFATHRNQVAHWVRDLNKALQRRVIRVSETFEESRSSGDARPEQGEWSVCPWQGLSERSEDWG